MIEILKDFAEKKVDLLKMEATEKSAMVSGLLYFLVIALTFLVFFVVFLILGLGLWIGYLLGNYAYGLFIMSALCLIFFIIVIMKRKAIQNYAANMFIKFLND